MTTNKAAVLAGSLLAASLLVMNNSWADDDYNMYEVTFTNLTPGQPLAPVLVATHRPGNAFFEAGMPPAPELADLAEAGNGNPMAEKLRSMRKVTDAVVAAGGTPPGNTTTVTIKARYGDRLSLGAMLGNTNDAFAGLADVRLPFGRYKTTYMAPAYDAGTETNDESCLSVPGPACGGIALSPEDDGEGVVYIHNGIHGIGGLVASETDWRNPVAKVTVKRKY